MSSPYLETLATALKPDPELTISEWADEFRVLPQEAAAEPGRYRTDRTPYLREPMDHLSPSSPIQHVVCTKATQLGWTTIAENLLFFVADKAPGPCLAVFPTDDLARRFSKKRIAPSMKIMPCLKGKVKDARARDSGNTTTLKEFSGGSWRFCSSNSGPALRSDPVRYLILDDRDGFELEAGGEGEPGELAKKRTDTYSLNKKIFENSTPTMEGISRIDKSFKSSSQAYYHIPCSHCGGLQALEWGHLKFNKNDLEDEIYIECQFCHGHIHEHQKPVFLSQGRWVHKYPERSIKGYHLNSIYSPLGWVSWKQIIEEFLKAKDALRNNDPSLMKVWENTRMAKTYKEASSQPDWVNLKTRCEPYEWMTIPEPAKVLTAGVDVQDNRLAVIIRAWGPGEESWLVYWDEIYGDPGQQEVWGQLDELLNRHYRHASGAELQILSMAVDTGGHFTQEVYNFCRTRAPRVFSVKGQSQRSKPVLGRPTLQDVNWKGAVIKNGIQLWPVGSDTAKATIYSRLSKSEPGSGTYHFPIGLDDEYFQQLTAEKQVTRYVKGFPVLEWVKTGPRNEALDCEAYCLAAAIRAGIARIDFNQIKLPKKRPEKQPDQIMKKKNSVMVKSNWMNR